MTSSGVKCDALDANDQANSAIITNDTMHGFHLPSHKADQFFDGNRIIVKRQQYSNIDPLVCFTDYLSSRDNAFPLSSPLWLTSKGFVPTQVILVVWMKRQFLDEKN